MIVKVGDKKAEFAGSVTIYVNDAEFIITSDPDWCGIRVTTLGTLCTNPHGIDSTTVYDRDELDEQED